MPKRWKIALLILDIAALVATALWLIFAEDKWEPLAANITAIAVFIGLWFVKEKAGTERNSIEGSTLESGGNIHVGNTQAEEGPRPVKENIVKNSQLKANGDIRIGNQ